MILSKKNFAALGLVGHGGWCVRAVSECRRAKQPAGAPLKKSDRQPGGNFKFVGDTWVAKGPR